MRTVAVKLNRDDMESLRGFLHGAIDTHAVYNQAKYFGELVKLWEQKIKGKVNTKNFTKGL